MKQKYQDKNFSLNFFKFKLLKAVLALGVLSLFLFAQAATVNAQIDYNSCVSEFSNQSATCCNAFYKTCPTSSKSALSGDCYTNSIDGSTCCSDYPTDPICKAYDSLTSAPSSSSGAGTLANGSSCATASQCISRICLNLVCVATVSSGSAPGVAGSSCGSGQAACGPGLACSGSTKQCAPGCTLDSDCGSSSLYCDVSGGQNNGACVTKTSPGQTGGITGTTGSANGTACTANSQCQSGYCQGSVCASATGSITTCPSGLSLVNGLCLPPNSFGTTGLAGQTTLSGLILQIITLLLTFAGVISVVMLIIGGYFMITAGGNEEQSEKGRKIITNFIIGLVVIMMAYAIVTILTDTLTTTQYIH